MPCKLNVRLSRGRIQWGLQVMLPSACSFIVDVSCHCITLHVSAYMAIFRCVGYIPTKYETVTTNIYNKAASRRNITCKTHWTIQCSRMLKYSIKRKDTFSSCVHNCLRGGNVHVLQQFSFKPGNISEKF
jgi:hypothetical protein